MKCLDGIQGPVYVSSGCCFNRKALYGFAPAFAEEDEDEKVKARALRRTMSAVPLLDSEDSDEETESGTLPLEATAIFVRSWTLLDQLGCEP
jgi:cellulose synthase A